MRRKERIGEEFEHKERRKEPRGTIEHFTHKTPQYGL